jgi:hypothetical protein
MKVRVAAEVGEFRNWRRGPIHQYNGRAPFERISVDLAGPYPEGERGKGYLLIVVDYVTNCPEGYVINKQEASEDNPVINSCRFGFPIELQRELGRKSESRLIIDV